MKNDLKEFSDLDAFKNHPVSGQLNELFKTVIKEEKLAAIQNTEPMAMANSESGSSDLSMNDMDELVIDLGEETVPEASTLDEGMELSIDEDMELDIGEAEEGEAGNVDYGDLSLDAEEGLSLDAIDESSEELSDDVGLDDLTPDVPAGDLSLDEMDLDADVGFSLSDHSKVQEIQQEDAEGLLLDLSEENDNITTSEPDLSADAREKLKEIDAIMDFDASQVMVRKDLNLSENADEPLVSEDLDLGSLNFSTEIEEESKPEEIEAPKQKKKKKESVQENKENSRDLGQDLREISGAYSGEMERMQATISNLRSDREELLTRIQSLEENKVLHSRQSLTMRAELDEKKIELTIIRKKLNEEINELKDKLKFFDEKKLILEEKNRILMQELDKSAQKNKIDVKKVQMRERELEQKLELLKSDAESQIRHRDLKILELKRKIDAMEFDMESISTQEKRSVESRFELEDKLEKAIKTLRSAITVLEDESDRSNALDALKKNINM